MLSPFLSGVLSIASKDRAPHRRRSGRFGKATENELGRWIWISDSVAQPNFYAYFRRTLNLASKPKSASISVAACSKYKLYVNGKYIARGPARAPRGFHYYDTHDITGALTDGDNVVAALVHYFGVVTYAGPPGKPGLNCRIEIELEGERLVITTDETWLARAAEEWTSAGERINENLGFQEVYDASLRIADWNRLGCQEEGWRNARVVDINGILLPRPIPILEESVAIPVSVTGPFISPQRDEASPESLARIISSSPLTEPTSDPVRGALALLRQRGSMYVRSARAGCGVVVILDFGREVFGNLEVRISRCSRGWVDIAYSKVLESGRVKPDHEGARYVDRIILSKGPIDWQGFEPRAFRYVQIEFRDLGRGAAIDYVRVNEISYPVRQTGKFECSDPLLNSIWRKASYTTRLCMEDSFVASPAFHRRLNWADLRTQARAAYYAFGDTRLLAKALKDAALTQSSDGQLVALEVNGEGAVDLMLLWIISLLDYYAFSSDLSLVQELYPNVKRLVRWFERFTGHDKLLVGVPGCLALEHSDLDGNVACESTMLNALYFHALQVSAFLAGVCNCQDDAAHFGLRANELKAAINKLLYVPERGLYASRRVGGKLVDEYGCLANVFAVLFGIADHYRKSAILRRLANGTFTKLESSVVAGYVIQALFAQGMHDAALRVIREKWGFMVEENVSVCDEESHGEFQKCCGRFVSPASDLISEYVGIKASLSSCRYSIAPNTADLKWARGAIETPSGLLAVEWRAKKTQLVIRADIPPDVKVDLYPPAVAGSCVYLNGEPQLNRLLTLGAGAHIVTVTKERKSDRYTSGADVQLHLQPHVEVLGQVYDRKTAKNQIINAFSQEGVDSVPIKHRPRSRRARR